MGYNFKHPLTDRQLMALLGVYFDQGPRVETWGLYGRAHEKAGTPVWRTRTNMGGAVNRMVCKLKSAGLLTEYDDYRDRDKPYYERGENLTAKGYEAIFERLELLPRIKDWREIDSQPDFDFNVAVERAELLKRMEERRTREGEIKRLREEEREGVRAQLRANAEKAAGERLTKLRSLFTDRGLADNWSDDELLAFAEKVASL